MSSYMDQYISYMYTDMNGNTGFGCCQGKFENSPPTFENIVNMQNMIRDKNCFRNVLILNWNRISKSN